MLKFIFLFYMLVSICFSIAPESNILSIESISDQEIELLISLRNFDFNDVNFVKLIQILKIIINDRNNILNHRINYFKKTQEKMNFVEYDNVTLQRFGRYLSRFIYSIDLNLIKKKSLEEILLSFRSNNDNLEELIMQCEKVVVDSRYIVRFEKYFKENLDLFDIIFSWILTRYSSNIIRKVLVVDDSSGFRQSIAEAIEQYDPRIEIIEASLGEDALCLVNEAYENKVPFDLVITDQSMPVNLGANPKLYNGKKREKVFYSGEMLSFDLKKKYPDIFIFLNTRQRDLGDINLSFFDHVLEKKSSELHLIPKIEKLDRLLSLNDYRRKLSDELFNQIFSSYLIELDRMLISHPRVRVSS